MKPTETKQFDVFVIGGGINGAGIARDATGRGYKVGLAEMNDFASATSSSSTKLFHGGLRYLEFFKFRLVREALIEREILLKAMPHISWPMRFVLPLHSEMRFENDTPTSKLLSFIMPWMKGRRPRWLIRFGLFLYDNLGGREILPGTKALNLRTSAEGTPLEDKYERAFEYSDCWVEDSRLTLLNIKDAAARGAAIYARTKVTSVAYQDDEKDGHKDGHKNGHKNGRWEITLEDPNGAVSTCTAAMVVNAGGPWVEDIIQNVARLNTKEGVRLVRGSHIVLDKLYDHGKCYFFQGTDGRIMFAIPYEEDYTLIGTTDTEHSDLSETPVCTDSETDYMIDFVNAYFKQDITRDDVVWSYSGVRPLYDDGASSATAATRDYVLSLNTSAGAPILNVFGGKITTYRKLAESALEKIDNAINRATSPWTAGVSLPGGDVAVDGIAKLQSNLANQLPFLNGFTTRRLIRQYGTQCADIFSGITSQDQLGEDFGHGVTAHEINWAIENEWVRTADDFLWRRSKMGIRFSEQEAARLNAYISLKTS